MSEITGTKIGARVVAVEEAHSKGNRETWEVSASFPAFTTSDTTLLADVGAYLSAIARDGKTRTLKWAGPSQGADNGSGTVVYCSGATVDALTISSDDLTGVINDNANSITAAAAGTKVKILVNVDAV